MPGTKDSGGLAPPSPPPVDGALGPRVVLACCYCRGALARDEAVFCAGCLAPHHADCARDHGRCAAPGCRERRVVRPAAPPRAPRARSLATVAALALAVAALPTAALLGGERSAPPTPAPGASALDDRPRPAHADADLEGLWLQVEREAAWRGVSPPELLEVAREAARLEARAEALLARMVAAARRRQVEELLALQTEALALARELEREGAGPAKELRARWLERLRPWLEGAGRYRFQRAVNQANLHLRAMAAALDADQVDEAILASRDLDRLVAAMRAEELQVWRRTADAVAARAAQLLERARAQWARELLARSPRPSGEE